MSQEAPLALILNSEHRVRLQLRRSSESLSLKTCQDIHVPKAHGLDCISESNPGTRRSKPGSTTIMARRQSLDFSGCRSEYVRFIGFIRVALRLYLGHIGIMEKNVESTIATIV